jgi:hypothetical protein
MLLLLQANLINKTNGHNIRQMDKQSWCDLVPFHECAGNFSGNCLLYDIGSLSDPTGCYRPNTCMTNHSMVCTEHKGKMCEYFSSTRICECKFRTKQTNKIQKCNVMHSYIVMICSVWAP